MTTKQRSKRAPHGLDALPAWMAERIREAELKFKQARFEDLRGEHKTAELLRDQAEAIYDAIAKQAAQPGAQVQGEEQRIANMTQAK